MVGYLNNPEATATAIDEDGWLRTGDIVYFDEEGYLHMLDRLKEMIKYKGFQVHDFLPMFFFSLCCYFLPPGMIIKCLSKFYCKPKPSPIVIIELLQIAPAELEAVLITHPDILDAAVTAYV